MKFMKESTWKSSKMKLLVLVFLVSLCSCNDDDDGDVFVATKDWKVVKKGQPIPKGLHVRINFETGVTEAKLLDPDEESAEDRTKSLLPVSISMNHPDEGIAPKVIDKSTLEEAMKKMAPEETYDTEELKKIKDRFRSYDEIKDSLKELNLTPKLDSELITELMEKHQNGNEQDVLRILEDLDYLAHQHDNAIEFIRQQGFPLIIYKNLNSTSSAIKKETLRLMSSLMQNNNKPKIHALETGAIPILLRVLDTDYDDVVKTRAVTALSALLRSFPVAQKSFLANGGLSVISNYFDLDDIRLQIKIITMVSDLIQEHTYALQDDRLKVFYMDFDLKSQILQLDWCTELNNVLRTVVLSDINDHDSVEKCLTAMNSLKDQCVGTFSRKLLNKVKKNYADLITKHQDSDPEISQFYGSVKSICEDILNHNVKTEL